MRIKHAINSVLQSDLQPKLYTTRWMRGVYTAEQRDASYLSGLLLTHQDRIRRLLLDNTS